MLNRIPRVFAAAKNTRAFHTCAPVRAIHESLDSAERSREEEAARKHDLELIRKMMNQTAEQQAQNTTIHIKRSSDELKKEVKDVLVAQQKEDEKKIQELQAKMEEMKKMLEQLVQKK